MIVTRTFSSFVVDSKGQSAAPVPDAFSGTVEHVRECDEMLISEGYLLEYLSLLDREFCSSATFIVNDPAAFISIHHVLVISIQGLDGRFDKKYVWHIGRKFFELLQMQKEERIDLIKSSRT